MSILDETYFIIDIKIENEWYKNSKQKKKTYKTF